ncbi:MAG: hypothetical protein LBC92_00455 [Rickettsiales bacterium]|jgi:hypothetical protein|nr:hypothetical protein [Rickettsiales bacterium]
MNEIELEGEPYSPLLKLEELCMELRSSVSADRVIEIAEQIKRIVESSEDDDNINTEEKAVYLAGILYSPRNIGKNFSAFLQSHYATRVNPGFFEPIRPAYEQMYSLYQYAKEKVPGRLKNFFGGGINKDRVDNYLRRDRVRNVRENGRIVGRKKMKSIKHCVEKERVKICDFFNRFLGDNFLGTIQYSNNLTKNRISGSALYMEYHDWEVKNMRSVIETGNRYSDKIALSDLRKMAREKQERPMSNITKTMRMSHYSRNSGYLFGLLSNPNLTKPANMWSMYVAAFFYGINNTVIDKIQQAMISMSENNPASVSDGVKAIKEAIDPTDKRCRLSKEELESALMHFGCYIGDKNAGFELAIDGKLQAFTGLSIGEGIGSVMFESLTNAYKLAEIEELKQEISVLEDGTNKTKKQQLLATIEQELEPELKQRLEQERRIDEQERLRLEQERIAEQEVTFLNQLGIIVRKEINQLLKNNIKYAGLQKVDGKDKIVFSKTLNIIRFEDKVTPTKSDIELLESLQQEAIEKARVIAISEDIYIENEGKSEKYLSDISKKSKEYLQTIKAELEKKRQQHMSVKVSEGRSSKNVKNVDTSRRTRANESKGEQAIDTSKRTRVKEKQQTKPSSLLNEKEPPVGKKESQVERQNKERHKPHKQQEQAIQQRVDNK